MCRIICAVLLAIVALLLQSGQLVAQCTAPPGWFPHATTPEPDFHMPTSNCEFHQWAWQEFLWLTQPVDGGRIRLLNLPMEDDLFSPGRAPAPLDSVTMKARLANQPLRLVPRAMKSATEVSIGHIRQATSSGVLVDADGAPVFYASFVSPEYYEFVRSNKFYLKSNYVAAPATTNFPKKAVELKSAWKIVPDGASAAGFFTTKAMVPKLKCLDGGATCTGANVIVDMTDQQQVMVALVGLHVVGVVEGHPEFIWSTFEHVRNAPDLPIGVDPNSTNPVTAENWTFCPSGAPANQCNQANAGTVSFASATGKLSPVTSVFRQFAFGGGDAGDTANIKSLNQSVHSLLEIDSIWKNYMLVGGNWFKPESQLVPGLTGTTIQPHVTGSVKLSNSTMETFTQTFFPNCFSCHATSRSPTSGIPAMNMNLSHILKQGLVDREQMELLAGLNMSLTEFSTIKSEVSADLQFADGDIPMLSMLSALKSRNLLAPGIAGPEISSYVGVQKLLDDFVTNNNIPIQFSPHGAFWRNMTRDQFVSGNIPNVPHPDTGEPMKILIVNNSENSNIIMSLRGTPGTVFDPATGLIGRMPPSGPFMPEPDVKRLAAWIDAGAPE